MPDHAAAAITAPDKYHIAATSQLTERARVLKAGDTFGLFDERGDICAPRRGAQGLFHEDTRYLSDLRMRIAGGELLLLASTVSEDATLSVDLTNPDILEDERVAVPREWLHVLRTKQLGPGRCHERLHFENFGDRALALPLSFSFAADFRDIFEVRGMHRERRGERHEDRLLADGMVMAYTGLDGERRETTLRFEPPPRAIAEGIARFDLVLKPGTAWTIEIEIACRSGKRTPSNAAAGRAVARLASSNALFDEWARRSRTDLDMLTTETPQGPYPYAGIPWFSTAFGRDGLIAALQTVWLDPGLARGVLRFLAATQATETDPANDAQPGKILHETRMGEMARLREVPFGRYYGSIDATPLFVMLAGAYWERTGDIATIRALWPNIAAALRWIERCGDIDGDGFLEYARESENGLVNQGWKDSNDSVFHADGSLAEPPIALAEVQGYAYAARLSAMRLARALGDTDRAKELFAAAMELRDRFECAFWCEELDTYALALDGRKRPCRVSSSNAGHALFCGIAGIERGTRLAARLMDEAGFSGWGIRTIAAGTARYNPMSYHDGSIWPHDNALIGMGFGRYDLKEPLVRLLTGLFEAAIAMDLRRLPELFCGFPRRPSVGPTSYPVACSPQAWSSAAVFGLVGGCLGVSFAPELQQIRFRRPVLPAFLDELRVDGLRLGKAEVDVLFRRHVNDVAVNVVRRVGEVEVTVTS
jgi:glycogen debranching enzyme